MERSRRTIVAPKRFSTDGEVGLPATTRDYRTRLLRHVYRPLKRKDITKELAVHEVHLFWPNDAKWYRANIEKIFFKDQKAYVHYPDDDTYEELDLGELIKDKHIAIIETRSASAKLRPGEVPVEQDTQVEYDDDASESSADIDSEEWVLESDLDDADDDELSESADEADEIEAKEAAAAARRVRLQQREEKEKKRRLQHKQVSRSKPSVSSTQRPAVSAPSPQQLQLKRLKPTAHGPQAQTKPQHTRLAPLASSSGAAAGAAAPAATAAAPEVSPEEYTAALVGMLMDRIGQPGTSASDLARTASGSAGGGTSTVMAAPSTVVRAPATAKLGSSAALPAAGAKRKEREAEGDDDVRRRVREQLSAALAVAAEELSKAPVTSSAPESGPDSDQQLQSAPSSSSSGPPVPSPSAVAEEIEAELYAAHGSSVSKEYKAKLRSLVFNLKDANNPDLRARVLQRELPSARLVRMSAMELASRDLSAWRLKKSEEFEKAKFLDVEAAAKFSTAAAQQLAARRQAALAAAAPDKRPGLELLVENKMASGAPPPDTEQVDTGGAKDSLASPSGMEGAANGHSAQEPAGEANGAAAADGTVDDQTTQMEVPRLAKVTLKPAEVEPGTVAAAADGEGEPYDPNDYYTSTYEAGGDLAHTTSSTILDHAGSRDLGPGSKATLSPRGRSAGGAAADVQDLAPIMSRYDEPGGAMQRRGMSVRPGDEVWTGLVRLPDTGTLALRCCYIGGMGDLGSMLGEQPIDVKGTVRLEKFEPFLEELRSKSRSRTVTLGLLKPPATTTPFQAPNVRSDCAEAMLELSGHYASKSRTGVCHPLPGLECYILAAGPLAARLLKTARLITPAYLLHLLPPGGNVAPGELLVAVIHRRDFMAPPLAPRPLAPPAPMRLASSSSIELPSAVSSDTYNPVEAHARFAPFSPPSNNGMHGAQAQAPVAGMGGGRPHDPRARPNDPRLMRMQQQQQQQQEAPPPPPPPPPPTALPPPASVPPQHDQPHQHQHPHSAPSASFEQQPPPPQVLSGLDLSGLGALAASLGIAPAALPELASAAASASTHPGSANDAGHSQGEPPLDLSSLAALAGALGALAPGSDQLTQPHQQQQQQQQQDHGPPAHAPQHDSQHRQGQPGPQNNVPPGSQQFALAQPGSESLSLVTVAADGTVLVAPMPHGPLPPGVMLIQKDEVVAAAAVAERMPDHELPRLEPVGGARPVPGPDSSQPGEPPLLMGPESQGILARAQQLLEGSSEFVAEPPAPHGRLGPMQRDSPAGPYSEEYNTQFFELVAVYEQQLAEAGPILPVPQYEQEQQQQQQPPEAGPQAPFLQEQQQQRQQEAGPPPTFHQDQQQQHHHYEHQHFGQDGSAGPGPSAHDAGLHHAGPPVHAYVPHAEAGHAVQIPGFHGTGIPPPPAPHVPHFFNQGAPDHAPMAGPPPPPYPVFQDFPAGPAPGHPGSGAGVRPPMPPPGSPPRGVGPSQAPYYPDHGPASWQQEGVPGLHPPQGHFQEPSQRGRPRQSRWE